MLNKKIILLLILCLYLAGNFTFERLNIGVNFEIKFLILMAILIYILVAKLPIKLNSEIVLKKEVFLFTMATLIFYGMLLFSIMYSEEQFLALESFLSEAFVVVLIGLLIFTLTYFDKKEYFMFVSHFFIVIGIIYTLPVITETLLSGGRGNFALSGPNVATRIMFFALCSSLYLLFVTKKYIYSVFLLVFLIGIFFVGSRGGLFGAALTLMYIGGLKYFLVNWKKKKILNFSLQKIFYAIIVIVLFLFFYDSLIEIFRDRFIDTTFTNQGIYTSGRDQIYAASLNMIQERPLIGNGFYSFTSSTGEGYPHNLILEVMNSIGIFGLFYFLILLFFALFVSCKFVKAKEFIFASIPLYMIIVQMFSGGLYDFRYYFLWAIPLLIFKKQRIDEND